MIYLRFFRFMAPLAVTTVVLEFGSQMLTVGMARMPQATETLAAFGLAWALVLFLASPLGQAQQLGLVLADSLAAQRRLQRFVIASGTLLTLLLAALATTPFGHWVVEDLHDVEPALAETVRLALLWLVPVPLVRGLSLFNAGTLTRFRRTDIVSYGMIAGIGAAIASVLLLLPLPAVRAHPIRLPVLSTYAMLLVEFSVVWWGSRRYAVAALSTAVVSTAAQSTAPAQSLTLADIVRFFWPLAIIMLVQELSRPLINLFIAREAGGALALAVMTVTYPLGQLPYRWLNDIRSLPTAFRNESDSLRHIRRFALACGLLSFSIMLLLYWTPLRDFILLQLVGVSPQVAELCRVPLYIFSFYSFAVMIRAVLHGIGLVERRTGAMAASAPVRLAAIAIALVLLPMFGVHGAPRGIGALLAGFVMETVAVWWGVRGRQSFLPAAPSASAASAAD